MVSANFLITYFTNKSPSDAKYNKVNLGVTHYIWYSEFHDLGYNGLLFVPILKHTNL
jgi:hypothetical protein